MTLEGFVQTPLIRYPIRKNELLKPWDAADELALEEIQQLNLKDPKILIANDQFGALGVSLISHHPTCYTDSFLSAKSLELNSKGKLQALNQLNEIHGPFDIALVRIPKNMSFFDDLIHRISQELKLGGLLICAYMIKHQSASTFKVIEKRIGPTTTSLAKKKARLIFATLARSNSRPSSDHSDFPIEVKFDGFQHPFLHHSNLFSRKKLDIGTRFFLNHIPKGFYSSILDLGCGNGIIGIAAKLANPGAKLTYTDESMMAILSAKTNHKRYFNEEADCFWTHGIENTGNRMFDLILCNPPFHQGTTVGDVIAQDLFAQAHKGLKKGGKIRVIGNSHLKYPVALKRIFGNSEVIASNRKFLISDAIKE